MKMKFAALLVALFFLCSVPGMAFDRDYAAGFALGKAVELAELVVVGSVIEVESVWRSELDCNITTDITIEVEKVVLGTPNAGTAKVKFMVCGGRVRNPETGKMVGMMTSSMPYTKFKVGQRALWFLYVAQDEKLFANYPHDKHQLLRGLYGRRLIRNGKVNLYYLPTDSNKFKVVEFPIDLATGMGEAFAANKDAAAQLEAVVKSSVDRASYRRIVIPESDVTDLKTRAKQIVDDAKTDKEDTVK